MALGWEWLTNTQRAAVRTDYKNAGIKLLVAAFGATGEFLSRSSALSEEANIARKQILLPPMDIIPSSPPTGSPTGRSNTDLYVLSFASSCSD